MKNDQVQLKNVLHLNEDTDQFDEGNFIYFKPLTFPLTNSLSVTFELPFDEAIYLIPPAGKWIFSKGIYIFFFSKVNVLAASKLRKQLKS